MTAPNVLAGSRLITKTLVKRHVAAAIASAQARNGWSNEEAGAALGICGNTVVNRKDGDDVGKQMTVFELLRSIPHDDCLANDILALINYTTAPCEIQVDRTCDRKKASSITRANLAVSVMLEDNEITDGEIAARRSELEAGRDAFVALLTRVGPKAGAA